MPMRPNNQMRPPMRRRPMAIPPSYANPGIGAGIPNATVQPATGFNQTQQGFARGGTVPMRPPSQSESGIPLPQPMEPNPLLPTGQPPLGRRTDTTNNGDSNGISSALAAVDSVFAYGRKLNGLDSTPSGDNEIPTSGLPADDTQSFADGGAVDDEENPANDPLVPVEETLPEGAGEAQAAAMQTPDSGEPVIGPDLTDEARMNANPLSPQSIQGGIKSIIGYLQGAGGDAKVAQQYEQQVDPQQALDADTRKLMAIQAAKEGKGDDEAWKVAQGHRQTFNHMRAFATAAATGINGKPADIAAAAKSATDAYSNIPDGKQVSFVPNEAGGVTATVTPIGSRESQMFNLSAQQFTQFLRGPEGHFDVVKDVGIEKVLDDLSKRAAPSQAPGTQPTQTRAQPNQAVRPIQRSVNQPQAPTAQQLAAKQTQAQPQRDLRSEGWGTSDRNIIAEAQKRFPWASQQDQMFQHIDRLEAEKRKGERDVAVAGIRATAPVQAATVRSEGARDVANINTAGRDRRTDAYERVNNRKVDVLDANTKASLMQKAQQHADMLRQRGESAKLQAFTKMMSSYASNQLTLDADKMERDTGFSIANALAGVSAGAQATQPQTQIPNAPQSSKAPQTNPPSAPSPGMKWQQNKSTGAYRQVPIQ